MRQSPISAVKSYNSLQLVNHSVDTKRRTNKFRDAFAFFVNNISIQESSTHACFATTSFKIESKHMRTLNGLGRRQTGTDGLASASETCKVVKVNSSQQNCL